MLQLSFTPFPTLTSDRLVLREIVKADRNEIFFLRSDEEVIKYLDRLPIPSLADADDFIEKISVSQKNNESITWAICLKDDPTMIGTICFWRIIADHYRAEIGYTLHPAWQKKGLMQEAISEVLKFGFNTMKLHSVEARINPNNKASIKILERNDFKQEGFFREDYFFNGKFTDTSVYSLVAPM